MTKTYKERLNLIAEEMAKANAERLGIIWNNLPPAYQVIHIERHKPLAAIALKHMAEEWKDGYSEGYTDNLEGHSNINISTEQHLINRGLIQPQKP